jgi:hypothetical protein
MWKERRWKRRGDGVMEFLYISLSSLGKSVSGLIACHRADQIVESDFGALNDLAFKLENGLLKLIETLERKQVTGGWVEHLVIKESNVAYSITPPLQYSDTPILHHSTTPLPP